jgi:hypothetical protein
MRRRMLTIQREELRRTLNTEQAETPVSTIPEPAQVETAPKRRGRPRKVKDDDIS